MAFTYDVTVDRGRVRLLIGDTNVVNAARQVFSDEEVDAFLTLRGGSVFAAAATALRSIAANEVQVLKVVKNLDLQTDGAKVSDALVKLAGEYEGLADEAASADDPGFEIAEMVFDPFTRLEHITNESLRA